MRKNIYFVLLIIISYIKISATHTLPEEAGCSVQQHMRCKPFIFKAIPPSSDQEIYFSPTIHNLTTDDLDPAYLEWVKNFQATICYCETFDRGNLNDQKFSHTPSHLQCLQKEIDFFREFFAKARETGANKLPQGTRWVFPDSTVEKTFITYVKTINFVLEQLHLQTIPELELDKLFTIKPAYIAFIYSILKSEDFVGSILWQLHLSKEQERLETLLSVLPAEMKVYFEQAFAESDKDMESDEALPVYMDEIPKGEVTKNIETLTDVFLSGRPNERTIETMLDDFRFSQNDNKSDIHTFFHTWALANQGLQKFFEHTDILTDRESLRIRNRHWAQKLNALAQERAFVNQRVLAVWGLGHFIGQDSIITLLRQQGWQWEIYDYTAQHFTAFRNVTTP